jgi:hypothetical protein
MDRSPVIVTMHLLTLRGFVMQRELMTGMASLACTDERCSLHVAETRAGIEVFLMCRRSLLTDERWILDPDTEGDRNTYHAVFAAESPDAIIAAIRHILDVPKVIESAVVDPS